jgi:hypothetical protein
MQQQRLCLAFCSGRRSASTRPLWCVRPASRSSAFSTARKTTVACGESTLNVALAGFSCALGFCIANHFRADRLWGIVVELADIASRRDGRSRAAPPLRAVNRSAAIMQMGFQPECQSNFGLHSVPPTKFWRSRRARPPPGSCRRKSGCHISFEPPQRGGPSRYRGE